jgi:hypothetical protein
MKIRDMPKLESPFEREDTTTGYVCVPRFKREFGWILDQDLVNPQEKFDGTNVSVVLQEGRITRIFNRTNIIDVWKSKIWFFQGIKRAIDEGKFKPDFLLDGQYFGELCGPKVNCNPLELDEHLWIPFDYCKEHYYFKFYTGWLAEKGLSDQSTDQELYDAFRELFQNLKSLWFRQRGIEKRPEGIVFHNKKTGEMCKLRCDMWDFWEGKKHKRTKEVCDESIRH